VAAAGSSTNISFNVVSKGTGTVQANGQTVETQNRRGAVNGYASLGADGKVPAAQLPTSTAGEPVIAPGTTGQYWRGDKTWQALPVAPVQSVNTKVGAVTITAAELNAVSGSNAGTAAPLTLWTGTAAQYNAIATKSPTTVYVVTGTAVLMADKIQEVTGVTTLEGESVEEPKGTAK
jgi:hypothetical protein